MSVPSHLGKYQGLEPADREHLDRMATAGYHKTGMILLKPEDLDRLSPWTAKEVINLAEAKHGKRRKG